MAILGKAMAVDRVLLTMDEALVVVGRTDPHHHGRGAGGGRKNGPWW